MQSCVVAPSVDAARESRRRALDVEAIAIELLHQVLIRNHAFRRSRRITDHADGQFVGGVGGRDRNEGRGSSVGPPIDLQERNVVAPLSGSMYSTSVTLKIRDASGARSSNSCALHSDDSMARPPTPRAKRKLTTVPSRDQTGHVAVGDDDVGVDEPAGAHEIELLGKFTTSMRPINGNSGRSRLPCCFIRSTRSTASGPKVGDFVGVELAVLTNSTGRSRLTIVSSARSRGSRLICPDGSTSRSSIAVFGPETFLLLNLLLFL